jgi:hypothetical protein
MYKWQGEESRAEQQLQSISKWAHFLFGDMLTTRMIK